MVYTRNVIRPIGMGKSKCLFSGDQGPVSWAPKSASPPAFGLHKICWYWGCPCKAEIAPIE